MPDLGVIQFLPYASFQNPDAGLTREGLRERRSELYDDTPPPAVGVIGWPRVQIANRRGDLFVIEASSPSFRAMLRFSPERPDAGDYEIHHHPGSQTERGSTYHVKAVPVDEKDRRASMLTPFPFRYVLFTTADNRAQTRMAWRIGLKSVEEVVEHDT
jgi:hypothetical protein